MSEKLNRSPLIAPDDPVAPGEHDAGIFATTHWSVVARAGAATTLESTAALDRLCRQYWQPLYYFVPSAGSILLGKQFLSSGSWRRAGLSRWRAAGHEGTWRALP